MLEIVYQDEHIVAINKPHGLLVHPSPIARDATEFALQMLRDQLGQLVYPAHRIDRKTSGILLFALKKEYDSVLQCQFMNYEVDKRYLAILRGFVPDSDTIDYALTRDDGTIQEAVTHYKMLQKGILNEPLGKYESLRYSLVEANPETGRMHQLRKHFAHIFHPILGDRPHGCNKQNRFWKEKYEMDKMMLHAHWLEFTHPVSGKKVTVHANPQPEFQRVAELVGLDLSDYIK